MQIDSRMLGGDVLGLEDILGRMFGFDSYLLQEITIPSLGVFFYVDSQFDSGVMPSDVKQEHILLKRESVRHNSVQAQFERRRNCMRAYMRQVYSTDELVDLLNSQQVSKTGSIPAFMPKPVWVVNNLGELGVKVNDQYFFLYKGDNLQYTEKNMFVREVKKREFGEVCKPIGFFSPADNGDIRIRITDTYHLEDGDDWKILPPATEGK